MKGSTILKGFLVLLAVVFIANQVISSVYKPVKTESAVYYTAQDGLKINGLIIRNETLVKYDGDGVIHFLTADGNRVGKNGAIANIYNNEQASITVSEIESVKKKISDIEDILSYNDIEAANIELITEKVDQRFNSFVFSAATGNYQDVQDTANELLSAINRKEAALGVSVDFSSQLNALKEKLTNLNSSLSAPLSNILAQESGYFVSKVDGYEKAFDVSDLSLITPEYLDSATKQNFEENVIGKIVSDYDWYIVAEVSINQSLNYKEGETLKILTTLRTFPELNVTVQKINISEQDERAVIILSCSEMNSELATMRIEPMTLVKSEYSGLRVPKNSLRVVDGQRGVYVVSGMQIKFVPVEIVYSTDSYIICKKDNDTVLKLYDRVVVKGRNLYDGKIVG